jgi:SAM-dependent methyltransferase
VNERLAVADDARYDPVEAAIHMARYALALPFVAGRRVLDVACGEGYGSLALLRAGAARVDAVDVSEEAIGKARITFKDANLQYRTADAERVDELFPEQSFDLVISCETIEHVNDPVAFLRAIRKIARRDAIIIITCPNDHWYYSEYEGNRFHRRKLTFDEFKQMTTAELGDNVSWHLGSASFGFATIPATTADAGDTPGARLPTISRSAVVPIALRVPGPDREPTPQTCSYFVGVWNAPAEQVGGGAQHVMSMDLYRDHMTNFTRFDELKRLRQAANDLGVTRVQASALRKENEIIAARLAALRQELDETARERAAATQKLEIATRELQAVGYHLDALTRERDMTLRHSAAQEAVQGQFINQIKAIEADRAALLGRMDDFRRALDWSEKRIAALDESLAWHVRRVQVIEGERDDALAQVAAWNRIKQRASRWTPGPLGTLVRSVFRRAAKR